MELEKEVTL